MASDILQPMQAGRPAVDPHQELPAQVAPDIHTRDRQRTRPGMDRQPSQHREDELEAGRTTGIEQPPRVIVIRESLFTGKRRPRIRRTCACGCGQTFTTTFEDKLYKNAAHKQKKYRNVTTRAGTKRKKSE